MTDFRKLCAELAEDAYYLLGCVDDGDIDPVCIAECREHLGRARAALSEPAAPGEAFPTPIAPIEALGPGHALPLPLPAAPGEGTP
jgi:hypothetical protein